MTATLFISPELTPAIMTDISVSYIDRQTGRNAAVVPDFENLQRNTVIFQAKKHYHVSRNTCLSIAGSVADIPSFLKKVEDNIQEIESEERPARAIGQIANFYRDLEVIAAYVEPKHGHLNHSYIKHRPASNLDSEVFGRCNSSGSGHRQIIQLLKTTEEAAKGTLNLVSSGATLEQHRKLNPGTGDKELIRILRRDFGAPEVIRGTFSALAARAILMRINHPEAEVLRGWGGFFEFSFYDRLDKQWRAQDPQIFLFVVIEDRGRVARLFNRYVVFRPEYSEILTYAASRPSLCEVLEDIRSPVDRTRYHISNLEEWRPSHATVTFCRRGTHGHLEHVATRSTDHKDKDHIIWNVENGKTTAGISEELMLKYLRQLADGFGKLA